jgi:Flp pilus assembly CpaE family ATPase
MNKSLKALVVLDEGIQQKPIDAALREIPQLEVLGFVEASGKNAPTQSHEDVLIVACEDNLNAGLEVIRHAVSERPDRPVVVLRTKGFRRRLRGETEANSFMQHVFEAGADDVATLDEGPNQLLETIRKAVARKRAASAATEAKLASVICVLGPKGGTGKTITTCNLAVALAETGARAVVVDLDLHFGDVALGLRLPPERTIYDLVRAGGALDAEKVSGFLLAHTSGLRVLLAPVRPDQAGAVTTEFVGQVVGILREIFDYVVVDTPAGFPPEVIAAIDSSTDVCMVGMLDAFSLKDTKIGLETLELLEYDSKRIRVVLNRADSRLGLTGSDATEILGRQPDILVPSERHIPRSVNEGTPIVISQKRLPAARAFRQLAAIYSEPASVTNSNGGGGGLLRSARRS